MRVLVPGGTGYVGTALIDLLCHHESITEIVVYDNLSRRNHNFFLGNTLSGPVPIRFIHGDILDTRKLEKTAADAEAPALRAPRRASFTSPYPASSAPVSAGGEPAGRLTSNAPHRGPEHVVEASLKLAKPADDH